MPNNDYANEPNQSRSEDIIQSILDNTEYDEAARSRIEYLLIELKNAIEGGGGGGGVTSYSPLTEKPKIDNHTLQAGNNTSSDLGLQTKLTFDSAPTENSTNPVTSGGVYTALGTKANSADVYNKSAVDSALTAKADKSTTYTKTEVDTALNSKQNTISDLSTIRSGAALGATAVQPVSGKGLSTNDYTTAEKEKLAGIEAQANKTTVDSALSDSSTNPVQNKVVKSALDGKQTTLTTAQLAAVNSGIDSAKVDQIETNKNNILLNWETNRNVYDWHNKTFTTGDSTTITDNNNGTYTVTKSATTAANSYNFAIIHLDAGSYVLTGCPSGYNGIYLEIRNMANQTISGSGDSGSGSSVFTIATSGDYRLNILLAANVVVSNITFKPMITPSSVYYQGIQFQPYAMSNAELTTEKADLAVTVTKGKQYVANEKKTYTLKRDEFYLLTVVSYDYAGFFYCV